MGFFLFALATLFIGPLVHTFVDRKPNRRTRFRVVELWLLWWVAGGGFWLAFGGFGHVGPNASDIAGEIGYRPSFFQWEVGWGDLALGLVGLACIWKRDAFMTAVVVATAISLWGDAIGHIMQWVAHDNTEPDNVWAIPSDVLQPLLSIGLLIAYRRLAPAASPARAGEVASPAGSTR